MLFNYLIKMMNCVRSKFNFFILFLFISTVKLSLITVAQAEGNFELPEETMSQKIIIHNVTFVDSTGEKKSAVASLIIKDKLFDLVTTDTIDVVPSDIIFDAQHGFLLGSLQPGEIANFLIVSKDPHKDIETLIDIKKYILLAIRDGIIIRNNLNKPSNISALAEQKKAKPKRAGWLAYTPPPMVIPSNYKDADWINFKNEYFTTTLIGALAMDRQNWKSQNDQSKLQVGDLQAYDGGEIRGLRFGLAGAIKFDKPWIYMISGATNAFDKGFDTNTTDNLSFFDWRLDIPTFLNTTLSVGKQKEPISMERAIGMTFLPMQERTVVSDALMPSRNVGAVLSGDALNNHVTWAGGIFNDWIDSDKSFSESATQYVGRTTWLPYLSSDESEIIHLGAGLRYSDAKEGVRFASEPEFNQSPIFVDSGDIDADNTLTYNLEASWRKGPLWIVGEYTKTKVAADYLNDPELSGYHVSAVLSLTGEMREYNHKSGVFSPISVARSLYQNGWGAWELSTRYSVFDGKDELLDAGSTDVFSIGASWWLSSKFNVNFNYRWIDLDRCSFINDSCNLQGKSSGFNTRIVLFL